MKDAKIYADAYQLSLLVFHRTKSYPKHLRPTLGRILEESSVLLLTNIRKATVQSGKSRVASLRRSSSNLDDIRIVLQLAKEMKCLSPGAFGDISKITLELGREIGGFLRYEIQKERS